jgi:hypothetical protein
MATLITLLVLTGCALKEAPPPEEHHGYGGQGGYGGPGGGGHGGR